MLLLKWLKRMQPAEIFRKFKRLLPWRSLTVVLVVAVVIAVVKLSEPVLWPGGVGLGKGESVATKTVETVAKNAQGQTTKTVETTKIDDGKTLWDWLSVIGVPLTLLILGYGLQQAQQKRAEKLAEEQRELAADETKEEVLQVYFDRLSVLLVDKNLLAIAAKINATESKGTESQPKISATAEERELLDSAVNLIRARTLSILWRFEQDPERKTRVIRFLIEADIVSKLKLSFHAADLSHANLSRTDLSHANLAGADLNNANLTGADLNYTNLTGVTLSGAQLTGIHLIEANLSHANLSHANLSFAYLRGVILISAGLSGTNLNGVILSGAQLISASLIDASLINANLNNANLSGAYLSGAKLSGANFSGANLSGANLGGANLSGANLGGAILLATDLRKARELTPQQLKGEHPPLLCNVALSEDFPDRDTLKDRDCAGLPQHLVERHECKTLDEATKWVEQMKKKQWT